MYKLTLQPLQVGELPPLPLPPTPLDICIYKIIIFYTGEERVGRREFMKVLHVKCILRKSLIFGETSSLIVAGKSDFPP